MKTRNELLKDLIKTANEYKEAKEFESNPTKKEQLDTDLQGLIDTFDLCKCQACGDIISTKDSTVIAGEPICDACYMDAEHQSSMEDYFAEHIICSRDLEL